MKTKINTSDLLKIINPLNDGVTYKGNLLEFYLHELDRYVEYPDRNQVFSTSENPQISFYKNLALYILNSNHDKYVEVDLNRGTPIEEGLFEYLKNIYTKQEYSYIEIDEEGDNKLFIEMKKLTPISLEIPKAINKELGELPSVFLKTEKITEKDKFFWKEENTDQYSNTEFVINKIKPFLRCDTKKLDEEFHRIMGMTDKSLRESDEFKLALLDVKSTNSNDYNVNLHKVLVTQSKPDLFKIDFSQPLFQQYILNKIKDNDVSLFETIFTETFMTGTKYLRNDIAKKAKKPKHNIDYKLMINQEELINNLRERHIGNHDSMRAPDHEFNITSCYYFLNKANKNNPNILKKYLNTICYTNSSGYKGVREELLFKLPDNIFNNKEFLSKIVQHIDLAKLHEHFKKKNIDCHLMKDKDFILDIATENKKINFSDWFKLFLTKKDITKEFFSALIEKNCDYFGIINKNVSFYEDFVGDVDLFRLAIAKGFNLRNVNLSYIAPILLKDNDEHTEMLLRHILIEGNKFDGNKLFTDSKDIKIFNEKYQKLEIMYFTTSSHLWSNEIRTKMMSEINDPAKILEILENISPNSYAAKFDTNIFYQELSRDLKRNKDVVFSLIKLGPIKYESLPEKLKFNAELAFEFIILDPTNVQHIRPEFFNDIEFSLKFTKLMDEGIFRGKESLIPLNIVKFFENQDVKEGYHDYLTKYINYNSLKEVTQIKEESKPVRKTKI